MSNDVLDGVMGLCVADALGVPVEFQKREMLVNDPVTGMRAYGTYNQPAGTWSDDTSMTLCLVDSLIKGLDYHDIMKNFANWLLKSEFTPYGETFDYGIATRKAVARFAEGVAPLECGGRGVYDNGNGSLMRILPLVFYLRSTYGTNFAQQAEAFEVIHQVSALTHAHERSLIACGIYLSIAAKLMDKMEPQTAVAQGIGQAKQFYEDQLRYKAEFMNFSRLLDKNFAKLSIDEINSSGYVVDTLEAAVWCLLNTSSYESCVLKAVNLGEDTDTVAAVAGGLAGLYYGYDNIPQQWLEQIARKGYIEKLCADLYRA